MDKDASLIFKLRLGRSAVCGFYGYLRNFAVGLQAAFRRLRFRPIIAQQTRVGDKPAAFPSKIHLTIFSVDYGAI
jgi:hypothetical protein